MPMPPGQYYKPGRNRWSSESFLFAIGNIDMSRAAQPVETTCRLMANYFCLFFVYLATGDRSGSQDGPITLPPRIEAKP
ncbi:hypothetical protein SAMN05192543_105146 [Paraburkholderia megapolitana]|uniref:Uncharacterized protein n=1 Tax=Paraburkholderia megapolitana TaxID=420953 RepID=A0A1I3MX50_9BURK|nr:hypothetical protein SAMN05192543_105146 [Paraburkholderia megapolitana]